MSTRPFDRDNPEERVIAHKVAQKIRNGLCFSHRTKEFQPVDMADVLAHGAIDAEAGLVWIAGFCFPYR